MQAMVNPLGTVYNPMSLASGLSRLMAATPIAGQDLVMQGGLWHSYDFHSRYSRASKEAALQVMNERIAHGHEALKSAQLLTITLGTAMVYRLRSTGQVVSNCHKMPQHEFARSMASVDEMVVTLNQALEQLHTWNAPLRVVVTVSPIRHVADGLEVNSLSKARLREVAATIVDAHKEWIDYFPAYEIMLDDLRDYRFYASDMVHLSDVAVEYVWQAFQATYLDDRSAHAVARCERVWRRLMHRPINEQGREGRARFEADTRQVVTNLVNEYPYLAKNRHLEEWLLSC